MPFLALPSCHLPGWTGKLLCHLRWPGAGFATQWRPSTKVILLPTSFGCLCSVPELSSLFISNLSWGSDTLPRVVLGPSPFCIHPVVCNHPCWQVLPTPLGCSDEEPSLLLLRSHFRGLRPLPSLAWLCHCLSPETHCGTPRLSHSLSCSAGGLSLPAPPQLGVPVHTQRIHGWSGRTLVSSYGNLTLLISSSNERNLS